MVIDCHSHLIPTTVYDELTRHPGDYPGVNLMREGEGYRMQIGDAPPTRPIMRLLSDLTEREAWMKRAGVDYQLNGGWLDIFGYDLPTAVAVRWSRLLNDTLLDAMAPQPQRYGALATVPLQDGAAAAQEVRRTREAGFKGILIGTAVNGRELDDEGLSPFWAAAAETGMAVMIHPMFAGANPRLKKYGLPNIVDRPYDTTLATIHLMYGGVLDRYPDLKVVLVHGGGYVPFQVGRFDVGFAEGEKVGIKARTKPSQLARQLYYDHVVYDPLALRYLVDLAGADHVLLGTDYPFPVADFDPRKVVADTPMTAAERDTIEGGAARAVFGI